MNFLNKNKGRIILIISVIAILTLTFFVGGKKNEIVPAERVEITEEVFKAELEMEKEKFTPPSLAPKKKETETKNSPTLSPTKTSEPKTTSTPAPGKTAEPIPEVIEKEEHLCTISVRCDTILNNIDSVKEEKRKLIPQNGVILSSRKVQFDEGETVFDVLKRELKNNSIHLEFEGTTVYDSVYIKGIANIYEFDAGDMSGWLYKVNGKVPSVGCSMYELKDGDKIEFVYTCNMGMDI